MNTLAIVIGLFALAIWVVTIVVLTRPPKVRDPDEALRRIGEHPERCPWCGMREKGKTAEQQLCEECCEVFSNPTAYGVDPTDPISVANCVRHRHGLEPLRSRPWTM
jgi:hypothetical protein